DGAGNQTVSTRQVVVRHTTAAKDLAVLAIAVTVAAKFETKQNDFTSTSYAPFAAALAQARALLADPQNASITAQQALAALVNTQRALVLAVNRTVLQGLLDQVEQLLNSPDQFTSTSLAVLDNAKQNSLTVLNNPEATQDQINQAASELLAAVAQITARGDTRGLAALVAFVDSLRVTDFTPNTWLAVATALANARQILQQEASQAMVDTAWDELTQALNHLSLRAVKTGLTTIINLATTIVSQANDYVPASLVGLTEALAAAQTVQADANASQTEVDNAQTALLLRVAAARLKVSQSAAPSAQPASQPLAKAQTAAVKLSIQTKANHKLRRGQRFQLKASARTAVGQLIALKYHSSNTKIASINARGIIKAKRAGRVTVTVRSATGQVKRVKLRVIN
ncbi:MAG: FIVAR domain-containing protein, partial [Bifidobacteriaceae bacterium]|nr:FIVAR domain-containing protein [Bifidobacteriaceae bacterium]